MFLPVYIYYIYRYACFEKSLTVYISIVTPHRDMMSFFILLTAFIAVVAANECDESECTQQVELLSI